jgi:protease-4
MTTTNDDNESNKEKNEQVDDQKSLRDMVNLFGSIMPEMMTTMRYTNKSNEAMINMCRAEEKQRRFRLFLWFVPIVLIICATIYNSYDKQNYDPQNGYVAQVSIKGTIALDGTASASSIIPALRKAFKDPKAKGVLVKISSPGGSPTQSILIHNELRKLQAEYDKKAIVIGEEGLTSGAYWIATAFDKIHALPATFTGSIGVIFSTYDVSKLAEKYEVEKHIIMAGVNKHRVDMWKTPRPEDFVKLQKIADQLHKQFIDLVKDRRGDRLVGDPAVMFSGDFWLGTEAVELGLIDSVTSTSALLLETFGTDNVLDYTKAPGFLAGLNPFAAQMQSVLNIVDSLPLVSLYAEYPRIQ